MLDAGFTIQLVQQEEMLLIVAQDALTCALDTDRRAADLGNVDASARRVLFQSSKQIMRPADLPARCVHGR